MPENFARYSYRLCMIYSPCGALYLSRTSSATEIGENQAFKKSVSFLEQKGKLFKRCEITTAFMGVERVLHISVVNLVRDTCSEPNWLREDI